MIALNLSRLRILNFSEVLEENEFEVLLSEQLLKDIIETPLY